MDVEWTLEPNVDAAWMRICMSWEMLIVRDWILSYLWDSLSNELSSDRATLTDEFNSPNVSPAAAFVYTVHMNELTRQNMSLVLE